MTARANSQRLDRALGAGRVALSRTVDAVTCARDRFESAETALSILLAHEGRVVVTGIGKSGLIGRKLSSTFASTGTPSLFVHSGEALHGDSGMVMGDDVVIALSKSGETTEVVQFALMLRARGIPVIAMTGCGGQSALCRFAAAVLDAHVDCECDPWNIVPSASTTVSLAIGDALAIALMVARDFGPHDFRRFHPGGSLGQRLEDVADV